MNGSVKLAKIRKTHRFFSGAFLRGGNDMQLSVVHAVEGGDSLGFYCEVFFTVSVKHLKVVSKHLSEHGIYPPLYPVVVFGPVGSCFVSALTALGVFSCDFNAALFSFVDLMIAERFEILKYLKNDFIIPSEYNKSAWFIEESIHGTETSSIFLYGCA